ncbi:DUF6456 domain-containing protein [Jannaschia ovalis]|uniref:DUF6456 domain-containing protein n=1 Tax=Jannaschia ovalis TaxID=3038773 RepID=A0ABY8LAZ3_9RHOB|nr:DUF6456 domain-containing protein [Jannaschia sp. GRR-S6-38]WGH78506.1 DUF6456 domain-containing protein [Jannaschia sp. GRR-S6-38]
MVSPPAPSAQSDRLPEWVPDAARVYLQHTYAGRPLRHVASEVGCAASTVLRQVRQIERRRDDPLVDDALDLLARAAGGAAAHTHPRKDDSQMSAIPDRASLIDDDTLTREARRVLRRLCESGAFLAVGQEMPQAVVLRDTDGTPTRIATLPKAVAQAFVLKDWVSCFKVGRVTRYRITEAGRAALRRLLDADLARKVEARGMSESPSPFLTQHMEMGERVLPEGEGESLRVNLAESPLGALARKRDRDGKPFLSMDLVVAGERLREDFERAQMGPRVGQNWERFLTAGGRGEMAAGDPLAGPEDARARVSEALRALGPGLADVVLRVCCFLEGLEAAEKRMGWAARSGKIVLRIALQRLRMHYDGLR